MAGSVGQYLPWTASITLAKGCIRGSPEQPIFIAGCAFEQSIKRLRIWRLRGPSARQLKDPLTTGSILEALAWGGSWCNTCLSRAPALWRPHCGCRTFVILFQAYLIWDRIARRREFLLRGIVCVVQHGSMQGGRESACVARQGPASGRQRFVGRGGRETVLAALDPPVFAGRSPCVTQQRAHPFKARVNSSG